jgi:hypothetical protein
MRFVAFLRCVEDEQTAVNASELLVTPSRIVANTERGDSVGDRGERVRTSW